jgi:hypothetical protein
MLRLQNQGWDEKSVSALCLSNGIVRHRNIHGGGTKKSLEEMFKAKQLELEVLRRKMEGFVSVEYDGRDRLSLTRISGKSVEEVCKGLRSFLKRNPHFLL